MYDSKGAQSADLDILMELPPNKALRPTPLRGAAEL